MEELEKPKHKNDEVRPKVWSWKRLLVVLAAGVAYGFLMVALFGWGIRNEQLNETPLATIGFLVLVPLGIGVLSVFAIPPEHRTVGKSISVALLTGILFLGMAALIFSGIFVCVLMAAPFFLVPVGIGALIMRYLARQREKRKHQMAFAGFILALPIIFAPMEAQIASPEWLRTVEDEIIIRGTPESVWRNIIRMDVIAPDEQRPSMYQSLGIPRPIRAILDHEGVGGVRVGVFEYGLLFHEEITVWEPYAEVRFNVEIRRNAHSTPILKQIGGRYFDIREAGYTLEALDNNRVRLRLNSTYSLSTNFNGYAAIWSDWIMHDFQTYVLKTVKHRVESS
jgi:hypothetical protein